MSGLDEDARAQIAEVLVIVAEQGLDGPRDEDRALDAIEAVITAMPNEADALRAENARLRKALDEIAFAPPGACGPDLMGCIRIAREALEVKP
jgi:hypothetical protein